MTFNLIEERWIPVRTLGGLHKLISPWEMTDLEDPIVALDAPRPDFNGALIQFLIGLAQTTIAPKHHGEWLQHWHSPPTPQYLHEKFRSVAHAFNLDGDGPRFMQDLELKRLAEWPASNLLIDTVGNDHFIKPGVLVAFCNSCAAAALFSLQIHAPGGGRGHMTSPRGGGPLTTLVVSEREYLWETVWLNTLPLPAFETCTAANPLKVDEADKFPWLRKTRTSERDTGCTTTPEDADARQVFWAMPRRIRLDFDHTRYGSCDICGTTSDSLVHHYTSRPYGVDYQGPWRHPLSPHDVDANGQRNAKHTQPGGVTYRHWLGLIQADRDTRAEPAYVVHEFRRFRQAVAPVFRLWAFGYDMVPGQAKARCWYEGTMPLPTLPQEIVEDYEDEVARFVRAAEQIGANLRTNLKKAWFDRPGDAKGDVGFIHKTFWQRTETDFYAFITEIRDMLKSGKETGELRINWRKQISREAMRIFDELAAGGPIEDADPKRIAVARKDLEKWNYGKKIAEILDLPLPKQKTS
ncbi:MAG: type I-E CRISPR-associated protein Cse1/CasA [Desulfomonilaceae bacterium]